MVAQEQLRSVVERIEALEAQKREIADEVKDVYAEAKSNGFSVVILREIVKLRRKSPEEREEHEALLDTYMAALGLLHMGAVVA